MGDELTSTLAGQALRDRAEDYVAVVSQLDPLEVKFRGEIVAAVNGIPNQILTVGDPVRVIRFAEQLVITSTAARYPVLAVVSAYASGGDNCTVIAGDDTFDAQIADSAFTPVVGDRVALYWTSAGCFVLGKRGKNASPADPPLPPALMNATTGPDLPTPTPPPPGAQTVTLFAQQTACYINGGGITTVDQAKYWLYSGYRGGLEGDILNGFWFYGDQTAKIAGVTPTKIEMWVQRATGVGPTAGVDFNVVMHSAKVKPTTEPDGWDFATLATLKPGQYGWFPLPLSWAQDMASGLRAGVAVYTVLEEPYKALIGIDHPDSTKRSINSGALRVTYKRS